MTQHNVTQSSIIQDTLSAAKARMRELAAEYRRSVPGLDAHSLMLGLSGVELKFMPMGDRDGAYDPEHRVILINSQVRPERQRFTLAHEISHALLLGDDDLLSDIHDAYAGDQLEQVIEMLCNAGAAAILMPDELVTEMISRFGATGRALAELAKRADVSASSALYTLAEQTTTPVIYAVCAVAKEFGKPENDDEVTENVLSVRVSGTAPGVKYSLRPGTLIPADHPVALALDTNFQMEGESYVPFRSGRKMPAYVCAYPTRSRAVTVSFALREGGSRDDLLGDGSPGDGSHGRSTGE